MTETLETKRQKLLQETLELATFDGWNDQTMEKAAEKLEWDRNKAYVCFPEGILGLIGYFGEQCDQVLEKQLAKADLESLKIRERIATAVMLRLSIYEEHKEAIRQLITRYALPQNAPKALGNIWKTVDIMWRAAGDTSTNFNYYSKRGLLAGVYVATVLFWTRDHSENLEATRAFLNRRIENVMQIQKVKTKLKTPDFNLNDLPIVGDLLKKKTG